MYENFNSVLHYSQINNWNLFYKYSYVFRKLFTNIHSGENNEYRDADKSLTRPTYRCILFDSENVSFDANFVIYI
jgi:hypothetical protein